MKMQVSLEITSTSDDNIPKTKSGSKRNSIASSSPDHLLNGIDKPENGRKQENFQGKLSVPNDPSFRPRAATLEKDGKLTKDDLEKLGITFKFQVRRRSLDLDQERKKEKKHQDRDTDK